MELKEAIRMYGEFMRLSASLKDNPTDELHGYQEQRFSRIQELEQMVEAQPENESFRTSLEDMKNRYMQDSECYRMLEKDYASNIRHLVYNIDAYLAQIPGWLHDIIAHDMTEIQNSYRTYLLENFPEMLEIRKS